MSETRDARSVVLGQDRAHDGARSVLVLVYERS